MTAVMERACTRSYTAALNTQKMSAATTVADPVKSSVASCRTKPLIKLTLANSYDRLVLNQQSSTTLEPIQEHFLAEPQPVKRRRRRRGNNRKRESLAELNNDQQLAAARNVITSSPTRTTNKENDEAPTISVVSTVSSDLSTIRPKANLHAPPLLSCQPSMSNSGKSNSIRRYPSREGQTAATLKRQREKEIEMKLTDNVEEGLVKEWFGEAKGFGVVAGRRFEKDEFVCEYAGELLPSLESACERDCCYASTPDVGCYMYYFKYIDSAACIDATYDNGRFGRLINHSRRNANVKTRVMEIDSIPRLYFVTLRDIEKGEELVYDYGERRPEVLEKFPWLKE